MYYSTTTLIQYRSTKLLCYILRCVVSFISRRTFEKRHAVNGPVINKGWWLLTVLITDLMKLLHLAGWTLPWQRHLWVVRSPSTGESPVVETCICRVIPNRDSLILESEISVKCFQKAKEACCRANDGHVGNCTILRHGSMNWYVAHTLSDSVLPVWLSFWSGSIGPHSLAIKQSFY